MTDLYAPPEPGQTSIEKLLGLTFVSDPRGSRHPLPEPPEGHPPGKPYTCNNFVITREIARDWLTYRVIRRERTPSTQLHPEFRDNRSYLLDYVREWAKTFNGEGDEPYNPYTHEGAAFSEPDGYLLDAQHRLAGFLLSDLDSIEMPVTGGVSWRAFKIMNKGRRRNASQMIGSLPHKPIAVGAVRHLLPVIHGIERDQHTVSGHDVEVIDIARGWPLFRAHWTKEVKQAAKSRIPASPLAASVIGAVAAGADPFEVQQFVDGLKPGYRDGYPAIGEKGEDPRRLLKLAFNDVSKKRFSDAEQRVNAGMIRKAMEVWLHRHDEEPVQIRILPRTPSHRQLPQFWQTGKVRAFHNEYVV